MAAMVSAARICFIKIFFFIHTLPFLIIPLLLPISTKKHNKRTVQKCTVLLLCYSNRKKDRINNS